MNKGKFEYDEYAYENKFNNLSSDVFSCSYLIRNCSNYTIYSRIRIILIITDR